MHNILGCLHADAEDSEHQRRHKQAADAYARKQAQTSTSKHPTDNHGLRHLPIHKHSRARMHTHTQVRRMSGYRMMVLNRSGINNFEVDLTPHTLIQLQVCAHLFSPSFPPFYACRHACEWLSVCVTGLRSVSQVSGLCHRSEVCVTGLRSVCVCVGVQVWLPLRASRPEV